MLSGVAFFHDSAKKVFPRVSPVFPYGCPMKLTEKAIAKLELQPGENDRIWADDAIAGFGLRIRRVTKRNKTLSNKPPSRTWIFRYRFADTNHRITIGDVSAIAVARAREIATDLYVTVKAGRNPAAEKRESIERGKDTFGALVERYLAAKQAKRPNTVRILTRTLNSYCRPLHKLPLDGIDRKVIATRLNAVAVESGNVSANRTREALSAMFSWAMAEGLAENNPVIGTTRRDEHAREQTLDDNELRLVWQSLNGGDYGTILKLLILTGQRLNEISGMTWRELDFSQRKISLPGTRTKNHRPHDVPLAGTAYTLLSGRQQNGRDYVFGTRGVGYQGFSVPKRLLDARIAKANGGAPIPAWTHHDIRRSVVTSMAKLGIAPHVIEALVNHVSGFRAGVAGVYNRNTYAPEKAEALAKWDAHINSLVGGAS
jgi:integrase